MRPDPPASNSDRTRERLVEQQVGEPRHQTGLLGQRDELVGHHQAQRRVVPPNQGLDAKHLTGRQRNLGLVLQLQLAGLDRVPQLTEQTQPGQ